MRGSELLDKLDLVDPAYVAEADRPMKRRSRWKVWGSLAACLCLAGGALWVGGRTQKPPVPKPPAPEVQPPEMGWESICWNKVKEDGMSVDHMSYGPRCLFVPGYFERELTPEECARLLPAGVEATGRASFDGTGEPLGVTLTLVCPSGPVTVRLGGAVWDMCLQSEKTAVSRLGEAEFVLWRTELDGERLLFASLKGQEAAFQLELPADGDLERGQKDFLTALKPFAVWSRDFPSLELESGPIPAWIERELTVQEALADPTFGLWALPAPPKGFRLESSHRSMSEYTGSDLLTQCWTRGYDQLDWRVERFTEEQRALLVHPDEREKYDMARYPIPRCDSVPEELREVVDHPIFEAHELTREMVRARAYQVKDAGDTDGWRTGFSVRYGDVLVTVSAKGVEPDWIYDRLCQLKTK